MRVLIVGDVHGQHQKLAESLRQAQTDFRIAAAIQVGDFGFYEDLLTQAREERLRFPVPLHVIDGNHEDHQWLRRAWLTGAGRAWKHELNLIYQPRPSVAQFGASKVGFLGGALHVDRPQKHNWLSGFPNYILRRNREQATTLFNQEQPELIVTHSCPSQIGIGIQSSAEMQPGVAEHITAAGFDAGPQDDCGEAELGRLWLDLSYKPRAWIFGPVWTLLYTMMAIAAWLVWNRGGCAAQRWALGLFLLQLLFNALWTPLFFGWHKPGLAFVDIVLLWGAIVATLLAFWRVRVAAGALLIPYLAWVSFAAVLNFTLWRLNR